MRAGEKFPLISRYGMHAEMVFGYGMAKAHPRSANKKGTRFYITKALSCVPIVGQVASEILLQWQKKI